jgi:hypothetical protein
MAGFLQGVSVWKPSGRLLANGEGTLTAVVGKFVAANFSGDGELGAETDDHVTGFAHFSSRGTLRATTMKSSVRPVDLTGQGALDATAVQQMVLAADLTGGGTLTAEVSGKVNFTPITEENVPRVDHPVPEGITGCWVTLISQGGGGGSGEKRANFTSRGGGAGAGGGAFMPRTWVPVELLGPTYSVIIPPVSKGGAPATSNGVGKPGEDGPKLLFSSGPTYMEVWPGYGGKGGLSSVVSWFGLGGITQGAPVGDGGVYGGIGGDRDNGSAAADNEGANAGAGGGGGGGGSTTVNADKSGGQGGDANGQPGGGSNGSGSPAVPGVAASGAGGGSAGNVGGPTPGYGSGGGGGGCSTGGDSAAGGDGGPAYALVEWVNTPGPTYPTIWYDWSTGKDDLASQSNPVAEWLHEGRGLGTGGLAIATYTVSGGPSGWYSDHTRTVTYGGRPMTSIGGVHANNSKGGAFQEWFILQDPPDGDQTVSVGITGNGIGNFVNFTAGVATYRNVAGIGTPLIAYGSESGTDLSQTIASIPGRVVVQGFLNDNRVDIYYNQSVRLYSANGHGLMLSDAMASASTTFTAQRYTAGSDYGEFAFELIPLAETQGQTLPIPEVPLPESQDDGEDTDVAPEQPIVASGPAGRPRRPGPHYGGPVAHGRSRPTMREQPRRDTTLLGTRPVKQGNNETAVRGSRNGNRSRNQ